MDLHCYDAHKKSVGAVSDRDDALARLPKCKAALNRRRRRLPQNDLFVQSPGGLGFDVLTYKAVRSVVRECYPVPNKIRAHQVIDSDERKKRAASNDFQHITFVAELLVTLTALTS
jgi:hypothetical protein